MSAGAGSIPRMMVRSRQPLDPALRRFLDEQAALAPGPVRTPHDARARMKRQLESRTIPGLPNAVRSSDSLLENSGGAPLRVRVYTPPNSASSTMPTLVYLHGGGWVAGAIETHDPFCRLLASLAGISIISVDYRLAPESPFPAALEDARAALYWAHGHAQEWGGSADLLGLGGDSSGGNLAAVTANRFAIERNAPKLRGLVLLYPATDHPSGLHPSYAENAVGYGLEASTMHWYWEQYAQGVAPDDPAVSPLRAPVLPPLPPVFLATADYDVLRDEGLAYGRKLREAGVLVTHSHASDMTHNFAVGPATVARFPQSDAALGEIAAFLRTIFAQG